MPNAAAPTPPVEPPGPSARRTARITRRTRLGAGFAALALLNTLLGACSGPVIWPPTETPTMVAPATAAPPTIVPPMINRSDHENAPKLRYCVLLTQFASQFLKLELYLNFFVAIRFGRTYTSSQLAVAIRARVSRARIELWRTPCATPFPALGHRVITAARRAA